MPDVLVYSQDGRSCKLLTALAEGVDYRVKVAQDLVQAREWLKLKPFDVALTDTSVSLATQTEVAGILWRLNPIAPFVVCDLFPDGRDKSKQFRLFGAETVAGDNIQAQILDILEQARPRGPLHMEEFKIMVVEDLDAPRDIICTYIEALGFSRVQGFPSAQLALNELKKDPKNFSCVITDIQMPEFNGKELIREIRGNASIKNLPIIVLTAYGTADCLIDCLKAGASGFLVKPPKKNDLTRELSRAYRIFKKGKNPRLASEAELEQMREILVDRALV